MATNRLAWSRKRVINLVAAAMVTMLILGYTADRLLDTAAFHPAVWLAAFGNMVQWCAYLATTLRDEVKEMLRPVESKVEEIEADVCEYGDRREAAGTVLALKLAGQRVTTGGRPLHSVD